MFCRGLEVAARGWALAVVFGYWTQLANNLFTPSFVPNKEWVTPWGAGGGSEPF